MSQTLVQEVCKHLEIQISTLKLEREDLLLSRLMIWECYWIESFPWEVAGKSEILALIFQMAFCS